MTDHPFTTGMGDLGASRRVRFPHGKLLRVKSSSGDSAEVNAAELVALDNGKVWITKFGPKWKSSAIVVRLETELGPVLASGIPEPMVDPANAVQSGYLPLDNPLFGAGGPLPSDVNQGLMGDCRIVSALQALAAAQPKLLMEAVTGGPETYKVRMRRPPASNRAPKSSQPFEMITVSCALAMDRTKDEPEILYCLRGNRPGTVFPIWPAIVEKALAHVWGGYARLDGALEDTIMLALGLSLPPGGKINFMSLDPDDSVNVEKWANSIKKSWAAGRPITAFIQGRQHNYAIVEVRETGVVISDPNTRREGDFQERWANPANMSAMTDDWKKTESVWPLFFTWRELVHAFTWVCSYEPRS
jgi:hypothetical protein